ncbi:DNA-binding transcriptional regulator, LysR family [Streptoalloteichus tenebrarius]|uniref:DNA-binding transcriptional regulator, LysR family n=2 Tax=Streptoalloteichus tenebrarius (strain ATCC 17920 / DSM 40477 / JCM 4838 / CBS 697.72 / NBRC 16177 / NCIMB 11028 / NRRL B-12390 / A12253. 1 / ISP 5477) TaxID=1933 RepID=A0ABT1HPI5_STRSD|nr:DNA-binding transcriptional regulator, LysR family [Streptoalloteichus tenebrarius]BFE98379.1 LysR family transcriptional regulator [Streptoalloteichus tenebrarius]
MRVLVAVAREGSFSAAAASLGLTQSAVSHTMRGIERKLGAVLFRRGRTGAEPTSAGSTAVSHARRILRLLETMRAETRAASAGELSATVRLAALRGVAYHLLPGVLSRFGQRWPRVSVEVSVVREDAPGVAGEVLSGRADLGVATLFPAQDGLVARELFADPYVLAYPAGHPDPRSLPMIHWEEATSPETRRWCAAQSWLSASDLRVQDDTVVLSMIAHGMGAAVVPRMTLAGAPPNVAVQPLEDPPVRRIGYVTTREMGRSLVLRELVAELRAQSREISAGSGDAGGA